MPYFFVPLTLIGSPEPSASTLSTFVLFLSLSTKALAKVDCLLSFVLSSLFTLISDLCQIAHRYDTAHPRHIFRNLSYFPDFIQSFWLDI